jgi:putative SOS response-associated peptidase YedK
MAGIFECWSSPDGGEIDTACILTTSANDTLAAVSERMPVIIEPSDHDVWLDCRKVHVEEAMRLVRPAPDATFELVEIGQAVNRVSNDGPLVQAPLTPRY